MDNWDKYTYYEKIQSIIAPVMGVGFGFLLSYFIDTRIYLIGLGIYTILFIAIALSILNFLKMRIIKKEGKKKDF